MTKSLPMFGSWFTELPGWSVSETAWITLNRTKVLRQGWVQDIYC